MNKEPNKDQIDFILDAPAAGHGANYTKQNEIKNQRIEIISTADDNLNLTEPSSPSHGEYLYNKVETTLSGHIFEVDDTPGAERICEMHKSGSFYEIHPDGSRVLKIFGDNFEITLSDNNLVVGGNLNITVQGNANILTKGNVKQKIAGNYDLTVHGNMTTRVKGERLDYTKGNHDLQTHSNLRTRSNQQTIIHAVQNLNIQTQANIILDSTNNWTQYCGGNYKNSVNGTFEEKSNGQMGIQSSRTIYLDGLEVRFCDPGPSISITNPSTNDPSDKDPTGGLTVEDCVIEPTFDTLQIGKTVNTSLSGIQENMGSLPKDRIAID